MSCLKEFSGCELVALASILAIAIAEELESDEVDLLGNFFSALGSNLSTISGSS